MEGSSEDLDRLASSIKTQLDQLTQTNSSSDSNLLLNSIDEDPILPTPDDLILSDPDYQFAHHSIRQLLISSYPAGSNELDHEQLAKSIIHLFKNHFKQYSADPLDPNCLEGLSNQILDLLGFQAIDLVPQIVQKVRTFDFTERVDLNRAQRTRTDIQQDAFDLPYLDAFKAQQLAQAANRPLFSRDGFLTDQPINPHIFDSTLSNGCQQAFTSLTGKKFTLPIGTTRSTHELFEEIMIPPSNKIPMRSDEHLIEIDELDPISRKSFSGYKTLNRLQSAVYPIAYKTNENMLICAPTGAGKTDVAMLTILRAISQYGGLNLDKPVKGLRNDFKIIYVAPMKALAAEIVRKMGKRLGWLGAVVKELTGDMQLTREEINATHLIVTTPEKWDVVTRKSSGEESLVSRVRLLIIDEVHLLHEDRGAVIETIVARTLRQVESSQSLIRIVGLSATLPNYVDVSDFLRVNRMQGLFYFDSSFRPVPLEQHFLGVRGKPNSATSRTNLDKATFEKVSELVKEGHQVMVFVHARKETVKTAQMLKEKAMEEDILELFDPTEHASFDSFKRELSASSNRQMKELIQDGFGIHHAGMLRSDRTISERLFEAGVTRVLCCTATLAWGVNLPAYAVIIKGTQIYDASKGSFVDLGILDVLQIFGRAGRPQYEDHGVGYICTTHDRLDHYVAAITQQHPIESQFIAGIVDSLNAEIALGTVRTIDEGVQWIGWTYLFVRMRKNPMVYGLTISDVEDDPFLGSKRHSLIEIAAKRLHQIGMIKFDQVTGSLDPTELGRIASKYYIKHSTIEIFNQSFRPKMTEADVLAMLSQSVEFDQIKVRDSELEELEQLQEQAPCQVKGGPTATAGKVSILLQAHVSRAFVEDFALVSDTAYVAQNSARIVRALVEISIWKKFAETSKVLVEISKCIEKRMWPFVHPLSQIGLSDQLIHDLDDRAGDLEVEDLAEMTAPEIASVCRLNDRLGGVILRAARQFPRLSIEHTLQPLTQSLLRVRVHARQEFDWSAKIHGQGEPFWVWIEDGDQQEILRITRIYLRQSAPDFDLDFILSFSNSSGPLPKELCLRVISDRWIGSDSFKEVPLKDVQLCPIPPQPTPLLELPLLLTSRLARLNEHPQLAGLSNQLSSIETQCFHTLFHTPHDALICAPEQQALHRLALFAIARTLKLGSDQAKRVLVIAHRKPIARQLSAFLIRSLKAFSVKISVLVEPSDLSMYASSSIDSLEIVVMTAKLGSAVAVPFYRSRTLTILMDLHNMSKDYENMINIILKNRSTTRLLGFSSSLMDPSSLSSWLKIDERRVSNFSPGSRSQPILVEFLPFNLPYSSNQWKVMVKPVWKIIQASPTSSVLIFVPSKHQCQAVAQQLVQCSASSMGRQDMTEPTQELWYYAEQFTHPEVADMLVHGVMLLNERMSAREMRLGIELFQQRKLKIMVLPRESSWKISNDQLKAEVVIVMGTRHGATHFSGNESGEAASQSASETELSELVQMQGFVGATSADPLGNSNTGQFVVMCEEEQLEKYQSFLKAGMPLESTIELDSSLYIDIVLQELASGGGKKRKGISRSEAIKCLAGTLLFERIQVNPLYYGIDTRPGRGSGEETQKDQTGWAESAVVDRWIERLVDLSCLKSLGLDAVELTEIGSRVVEEKLSVDLLAQLRSYLKDNSRKTIGKLVEQSKLSTEDDLIARTKDFYSKLPRVLKDQNAWFIAETTSSSPDKQTPGEDGTAGPQKTDDQQSSRPVIGLLLACFEAGRIPFNDTVLAREQAHLVVQSIKLLFKRI
ncbi:hypothetical protein PTTG_08603 [Puccinia triticina 1-1 BBBD Race 1]|uniref:Sec63-domain-containing protein n=1 Tax=Puccinia triticina (isolate 1-1 / race 1 (BBBD)) TaxID=630390 RepID=A0A180GPP4_PUCT1|nr:hypothetical protein PTTG_08603 [Puccinia triticina 1-1 BBBD Race 1]